MKKCFKCLKTKSIWSCQNDPEIFCQCPNECKHEPILTDSSHDDLYKHECKHCGAYIKATGWEMV